ncbi:hypothetical protein D039_2865A, partial [Vibrio parahaemolyticus EKP-028]
MIGDGNGSP